MLRFVLLLFACLSATSWAEETERVYELDPFTTVKSCISLSIRVRPSRKRDEHEYGARVSGEESVVDAIRFEVVGDILELSLDGEFTMTTATRVEVVLPEDSLVGVESQSNGQILVDSGFDLDELTVRTNSGDVRVDAVTANKLVVETAAKGMAQVGGSIQEAYATADGISSIYIRRIKSKATVEVAARANVYLKGSRKMRVEGSASALGSVYVDRPDRCQLSSGGARGYSSISTGCKSLDEADVPEIETQWTSEMQFSGKAVCIAARPGPRWPTNEGRFSPRTDRMGVTARYRWKQPYVRHGSQKPSAKEEGASHLSRAEKLPCERNEVHFHRTKQLIT